MPRSVFGGGVVDDFDDMLLEQPNQRVELLADERVAQSSSVREPSQRENAER